MSRGSRDFSNVNNTGINFGVAQPSEILNRPQGVFSYDLRGQAIYYNNFEMGTHQFNIASTNTPIESNISIENVYNGAFCLSLETNVIINSDVRMSKNIAFSRSSIVGIETRIRCNDTDCIVFIILNRHEGSVEQQSEIQFNTTDDTIKYKNTAGTYTEITPIIPIAFPNSRHLYVKLVVDFNTGFYKRLILNENIYDISSFAIRTSSFSAFNQYLFEIGIKTNVANAAEMQIDDVLLTVEEPE